MPTTSNTRRSGLVAVCSRDAQLYLESNFYKEVVNQILRLNKTGDWNVDLVIVDNSGRKQPEVNDPKLTMAGTLVYETEKGIPCARNKALDFAREGTYSWMLFTDDDVLPSPDWLNEMVSALGASGSDAVQGAWCYEYPTDYDPSLPRLENSSWQEGENLLAASTINVIFWTKPVWDHRLSFDNDLKETGGSDTKFFVDFRKTGCRISYTMKGLVTEPIIGKRATLRWHLVRRLRVSQSHLLHIDPKLSRLYQNSPSPPLSQIARGVRRLTSLFLSLPGMLLGSAKSRKDFLWGIADGMSVVGFLLLKAGIRIKEYKL